MNTALVVIDVQVGIARHASRVAGWPAILANIAALVTRAQTAGMSVIFIQHDGGTGHPLEPGTDGSALCPELGVADTDVVIHKTACDAFFETTLESLLRERNARKLIVAGCMTEYCVDTSVRRAVSLGFDVMLAADAHGTIDSAPLQAAQIIAHHNRLLDGFAAGSASVIVAPSAAAAFS